MRASVVNDVKIYTLGRSEEWDIPEGESRRLKKKLREYPEWDQRIDLIQDFEFPEASSRLKCTEDGEYIIATGVYKPQIRVFDLSQKSMKFERHTDAETLQFEILSQDWSKIALLQSDRTVELHARYGMHYRMRVPRFGRDMAYDCATCELFVGGNSTEVWRINLELGSLMKSYSTELPEVNVLKVNPSHGLLAVGGTNGTAVFFHPEEKKMISSLKVAEHLRNKEHDLFFNDLEITAAGFCEDGVSIAFGMNSGHVLIYDLRSAEPITIEEHMYNFPIKFVGNHGRKKVVSADKRSIRIWDRDTGDLFTTVEPKSDLNDVCLMGTSGMFACAVEGSKMEIFYIPSLGPAPEWCPYVENFTEELEAGSGEEFYASYKFVTPLELERLSLSHLIGTDKLSPYMHGFFIDFKLYRRAKEIAAPFAYEEYKKRAIKERYEKLTESRILPPSNYPKVNRDFAERMSHKLSSFKKVTGEFSTFVSNPTPENPTGDPRFEMMFRDENFVIDDSAPEWKLRHPSQSSKHDKKSLKAGDHNSNPSDSDDSDSE